jgi:Family of unknown function (DUF5856)
MEDILVGISIQSGSLLDKTFIFLIKLMGYRNQIRLNHWQTKSFAEHKMTDQLLGILDDNIDKIGESTIGAFGRPKINTMSTNIGDIAIISSEYVLNCINKDTLEMLECYKESDQEGIFALLGDFDAEIKKFIYLSTLS